MSLREAVRLAIAEPSERSGVLIGRVDGAVPAAVQRERTAGEGPEPAGVDPGRQLVPPEVLEYERGKRTGAGRSLVMSMTPGLELGLVEDTPLEDVLPGRHVGAGGGTLGVDGRELGVVVTGRGVTGVERTGAGAIGVAEVREGVRLGAVLGRVVTRGVVERGVAEREGLGTLGAGRLVREGVLRLEREGVLGRERLGEGAGRLEGRLVEPRDEEPRELPWEGRPRWASETSGRATRRARAISRGRTRMGGVPRGRSAGGVVCKSGASPEAPLHPLRGC